MKEIYQAVPGYEGLYEVSNLGNVRSVKNSIDLKQYVTNSGYLRVVLYKNGVPSKFSVHRLVAMTFIPNPNDLPMVNHKDEDKLNNCIDNLEWCTNSYNQRYGTCQERISSKLKGHSVSEASRAKMSEKATGQRRHTTPHTEESKAKMSAVKKGKHPTDESKAKTSASMKAYWEKRKSQQQ